MNSTNTIQADRILDEAGAVRRPARPEKGDPVGRSRVDLRGAGEELASSPLPTDLLSPEISESLVALNEMLQRSSQQLSISVDPVSGAAIFRIVDTATGDVVIQVPCHSKAQISKALLIRRGLLIDTNQ